MKKIVLAPDSFKGTLTSADICHIVEKGVREQYPQADIRSILTSDGGEGVVDAFVKNVGGKIMRSSTTNATGERIKAAWGWLDAKTAIVESAAAVGLPQTDMNVAVADRTSYGVGEMILAAIRGGARHVLVGLGGSSTNDGGAGAAAALGIRFYNSQDKQYVPTGRTLADLKRIDRSGVNDLVDQTEITLITDVFHTMCGPAGATAVFGPQKGAGSEELIWLDRNLEHLANCIARDLDQEVVDLPGGGAAGGMGAGLAGCFNCQIKLGIEALLEVVKFDTLIKDADLIITGEGRLDAQSLQGKVIYGVTKAAKRRNVPVIALVGDIAADLMPFYEAGLTAAFSIQQRPLTSENIKLCAGTDLYVTVVNLMRWLKTCQ
ncbi:MAG TPA: glycerate kinase [Clostridiaceae bacterium]|nr:glycerate kinase [Clostridiaceae bacterium]